MIDWCLEEDCRRRVGVVVREGEGELEGEPIVGRFSRPSNRCRPGEQVAIGIGEGG